MTTSSLEATGNAAYRKGTEQHAEVPFTWPGTWQELWVCEPAEHGRFHALMPRVYLQNIKHRTDVLLLLQTACSVSTNAKLEPAREGHPWKGSSSLATWTSSKATTPTLSVKSSGVYLSLTENARGLLSCSPCSFDTCPRISQSGMCLGFDSGTTRQQGQWERLSVPPTVPTRPHSLCI